MKWRNRFFRLLMAALPCLSVFVPQQAQSSTMESDSVKTSKYEQRLTRGKEFWERLAPNLYSVQFAGGMGMFSVGMGWDYGSSDQWETHLSVGFLPNRYGNPVYWTATLKENYMPWRVGLGNSPLELRPFCVALGLNSILHGDFWTSEPDRYPGGYYGFSSRLRFILGVGQRLTVNIPYERRRLGRQLSVYYEVSTCDLYVRQKILCSSIPLKDIITLGIGVIYTI